MSKKALIVEDLADQLQLIQSVLERAGYDAVSVRSAFDAEQAVDVLARPLDLIVLDRRLPYNFADEPTDNTGDALLERLAEDFPDTPFIVFTGHASVRHVQRTLRNRGVLHVGSSLVPIDRVSHFEKDQSIEFQLYVDQLAEATELIGDVDLRVSDSQEVSVSIGRLLRKVAMACGGTSMVATRLTGGLTSASVWECSVSSPDGADLAHVIAKLEKDSSSSPKPARAGGLHSILEAPYVAAVTQEVSGVCDSWRAQVMQYGGRGAKTLLETSMMAPEVAGSVVRLLATSYESAVGQGTATVSVADLVAPIIDAGEMQRRLLVLGVTGPRTSRQVTIVRAAQHGDLHGANILVSDGLPILIDFDSEAISSRLLDPVTLLLSSFFHANSPWRSSPWPSDTLLCSLLEGGSREELDNQQYFAAILTWIDECRTSERELWTLVLAYAVRQLKYGDVTGDPLANGRATALVLRASEKLSSQ